MGVGVGAGARHACVSELRPQGGKLPVAAEGCRHSACCKAMFRSSCNQGDGASWTRVPFKLVRSGSVGAAPVLEGSPVSARTWAVAAVWGIYLWRGRDGG